MKTPVLTLASAVLSSVCFAYIPEPQPQHGPIEVTAFYYPGTEHMPEWNMVEQVQPERKPLLGWYDESDPENIDWQIKWAVEHGISSFCVCWYWNKGVQRLDHWVKAYYKAKFRRHLKWFMMYANHNDAGAHSTADQIAVSKFWIDNYFKTPEYYTIDGKPVVVIWFCDAIDRDFIAEAKARGEILQPGEGVKRAFAITERMAKEAGLPGVCWIDMYHGNYDPKKVDYAKAIGCKAQMIYSFVWQALTIAKDCRKPTDTDRCFSYDLLDVAVQRWWEESTQDDSLPFWPMLPTGWDARSRYFQRSLNVVDRTPEKFGDICRKCRAFCEKKGLDHVVVMPINEWQEGSYIEPNEEYGFGMYDALRDAFCEKPAEGWPKNLTPQDIGRPLKEYPPMFFSPVQEWTFDRTTEGWYRQPYGAYTTRCIDGALHFLTTFADNFQVRQRLVPFAAEKYRTFRLRMKVVRNAYEQKDGMKPPTMRLKWGTIGTPIIRGDLSVDFDRSVVSAPVIDDGEWHEYALDLSSSPDWKGNVNELWFEAINAKHAVVDIDWMKFSDSPEKRLSVAEFATPPDWAKPWTYWLWMNGHTDEKSIVKDLVDIKALGFGGVLLNDARGYWEDDEHIVTPPAEQEWMSPTQVKRYGLAMRQAKKLGLEMAINTSPNGGKLCGPWKVGADAPKRLLVSTRPLASGEKVLREQPAVKVENFRDICLFAVKTVEPLAARDWYAGGDGLFTMEASSGRRVDVGHDRVSALSAVPVEAGWTTPDAGNWSLVRIGYATMENREYDADILDPEAVRRHFVRYFSPLKAELGDLIGTTLTHLYSVSWEGAMPNWAPNFERDYARLTGRDVIGDLPTLAGFDLPGVDREAVYTAFRRARNDMFKENFYGTFASFAHAEGLKWFSESGGPWKRNKEVFGEADQMEFLSVNDVPQGEFWVESEDGRRKRWHLRGSINTAHVYGRPLVSVEAFTHMLRHWSVDPAALKPAGDIGYADGANRYLWHTYTCSPERFGVPGIEYFAGTHINRNVTWHDDAKAFITYLARCQYLLQSGEPITDIAVLGGNRTYSHWGRFRDKPSNEAHLDVTIPNGFSYDLVNDDALAKNPKLLDRYAIVYDARRPENLKKTIPVGDLLPDAIGNFTWAHRRLGDVDIYFVVGEGKGEMTFRASSASVEEWDAVTGTRRTARAERLGDGRTKVKLDLPIGGSVFVMFLPEASPNLGAPIGESVERVKVEGPWSVSFAYPRGVKAAPPASVTMDRLVDFTSREDLAHFAGTATYRTAFDLVEPSRSLYLSLGAVPSGLAHVFVNGIDCGTVWCAPWAADVSAAVRTGRNELEIRYVNNWVNRFTGDCALPPERRVTQSDMHYWSGPRKTRDGSKLWTDYFEMRPTPYSGPAATDPLQHSGLLGPVRLVSF